MSYGMLEPTLMNVGAATEDETVSHMAARIEGAINTATGCGAVN